MPAKAAQDPALPGSDSAVYYPGMFSLRSLLTTFLLLLVFPAGCGQSRRLPPPGDEPNMDGALPDAAGKCVSYPDAPLPGYTMFGAPRPDGTGLVTVLVDMDGNLVHTWELAGFPAKLLPGGSVIGAHEMRKGFNLIQDALSVVEMSWDGKILWSFKNFDADGTKTMMARQHHDLQRQGNPVGYYAHGLNFVPKGKTLILGHRTLKVPAISKETLLDDTIYEVTHAGKLTGFIWEPVKHFNEMGLDAAAKKAIYDNPNFNSIRGNGDWLHINSISLLGSNRWYDSNKDQRFHPDNIIISSREASFLAIISRATGKIVWRVGPDFSAGKPGHSLGPIIGPHHGHMIPKGLPGDGNILVFDNGGNAGYGGPNGAFKYHRDYSRVVEFNPVTLKMVWQYGASSGPRYYYSAYISSVQRLPNGNTLINVGADRKLLEVTRSKKEVWRYTSPFNATSGLTAIYRAIRVPPEWLPAGMNKAGYAPWSKLCSARTLGR